MEPKEQCRKDAIEACVAMATCLAEAAAMLSAGPTDSYDHATKRLRMLSAIMFGALAHLPVRARSAMIERLHRRPLAAPVLGGHAYVQFELIRDFVTVAQGAWEPQNMTLVQRVVRSGDVALDVGAHSGHYAILLAALVGSGGRVLAFEPAPANVERLRQNLRLNGIEHVTEALQMAVSEQVGEVEFFADGDTGGTEFSMFGQRHGAGGVAFRVACTTLDAVLGERGVERVHFMKIDTEGAELAVLRGAEQTIRRSTDLALLIELHPWVTSPAEVCEHLRERGFCVHHVQRDCARVESQADVDGLSEGGDILATRRPIPGVA
jgi:FkbM family methyltransferase